MTKILQWFDSYSLPIKIMVTNFWAVFYIGTVSALGYFFIHSFEKDFNHFIQVHYQSQFNSHHIIKTLLEERVDILDKKLPKTGDKLLGYIDELKNLEGDAKHSKIDHSYWLYQKALEAKAFSKAYEYNQILYEAFNEQVQKRYTELKAFEKTFRNKRDNAYLFFAIACLLALGVFSYATFWMQQTMRRKLRSIHQKIEIIQKKEFDIGFSERSEVGDLGLISSSLSEAIKLLKKDMRLKENQAWINSNLLLYSQELSSEKNFSSICIKAPQFLAKKLPLLSSVVYRYNENDEALIYCAGYAIHTQTMFKNLSLGEGLVGQVALEKEPIFLDATCKDGVIVQFGTHTCKAHTSMIYPLLHHGRLLGVVSLGFAKSLSSYEKSFLEQAIIQLSFALEAANEHEKNTLLLEKTKNQARELEKSNEYKSEFLSTMSHELKTPLNSIVNISGVLARNKLGNLAPKQIHAIGTIYDAGNDLLNIINNILDMSRLSAKRMPLDIALVELNTLMMRMRYEFSEMAREKSIELSITNKAEPPVTVHSDSGKIVQILRNLISNALKFTQPNGKVDLTLDYIEDNGKMVYRFCVQDNGPGIPEDFKERIFEPFSQADGSIRRSSGGSGLGLAICQKICVLLEGEITLQSQMGQGTTICFTVPALLSKMNRNNDA